MQFNTVPSQNRHRIATFNGMDYQIGLIGAGPIGIETAAVLKRAGISYVHLEKGQIGNTITKWPRNTHFFSSPEWIAIAGIPIQTSAQAIPTGEEYLAYLRSVVEILQLQINTYEPVVAITGHKGEFRIETTDLTGNRHRYHVENVILATGDMNRPNAIGVPGEQLPHVTHLWQDPHTYFQRQLLIVGGRNSAVEAAVRCWRAGAHVSISYRGAALDEKRLISRLFLEADLLIKNGQIRFYPTTVPARIEPGYTTLRATDLPQNNPHTGGPAKEFQVASDFVYLATGFQMDESLYATLGVDLGGEERKPWCNPDTMETNVPGVYVVGTTTGGNQRRYAVFITTSHEHVLKAVRSIAPDRDIPDSWVGNYAERDYPLSSKDVE